MFAKPLPYGEVTDASYTEFADTCDVIETAAGVRLAGTCRRCGHTMSFPVPDRTVARRIRAGGSAQGGRGRRQLSMLCTCGEPHPGRPAEGHGCGAFWNVDRQESAP